MTFTQKDCAGDDSIHRAQKSQRALLKLESRGVASQGEIVEAKSLARPNAAELLVEWIGIGERQTLSRNRDFDLLLGDDERELQLHRGLQLHRSDQRLE